MNGAQKGRIMSLMFRNLYTMCKRRALRYCMKTMKFGIDLQSEALHL